MALIKSVRGFTPQIGENTYLSENATIVGDVTIGKDCSIWFNAVLRGDVNPIRIGDRVNIQDGSVLHTLYERSVVEIGNDVSVGHNVTIHGATIKDGALIGMGSTILDYAVVGEGAIVAAGALVLSNTVIEPGIYKAGRHGIRIENTLLIVPSQETEFGKFYQFEPLTLCPIDKEAIIVEMLTDEELKCLNDYHEMIYNRLSIFLNEEEQAWLKEATSPLKR